MTNTRSTRSSSQPVPQKHTEDVGASGQHPPPFLTKTYDMVSDPKKQSIVSWNADGESFTVWDHTKFSAEVLPLYFKHNNFSSFVRQLNTYGFRKSDADRWEFRNEYFIRGRKDLLKNIHRKKAVPGSTRDITSVPGNAVIEVGSFGGLVDEVQGLKRDKNVLMMELVRLRQQQQASENEVRSMKQRLEATEMRQHHMMAFLAKAVNNPAFLQHFLTARNTNSRITDSKGRKKRRASRAASDMESMPQAQQSEDPMKALVSYQPQDNLDFSSQFLGLLEREGQSHLHTNGLLPNGGAHLEVEGLSDNSSGTSPTHPNDAPWSPPEVSDMGTAFDSLNLSNCVPSTVTIEPLPNGGASRGVQDMLTTDDNIPHSAGFMGPPPHTSAGFGAGRRFAPSAMSASDFGMPEILPSTSMSPRDLLLHGASHPGTSDRDFSFAGGTQGPSGALQSSPFGASTMQNGGGMLLPSLDLPRMSLDMQLPPGTPPDMFAMDGSDPVGQEFWNQLTSISSELAPGDMWQQPPTPHSAAVGSMPIPAADLPIQAHNAEQSQGLSADEPQFVHGEKAAFP